LRAPLGAYFRAFAVVLCGWALGLGLTAATLGSGYGFGALRVGPWTAWPQIGGLEINPFARAALAKRGEAPLGKDQGMTFVAEADSSGAPLEGRCEYRLEGSVPRARFWTIGLASSAGEPLANLAGRHYYASSYLLRREGGAFDVAVARQARPGNWLSPGDARSFVVVLRLYETPLDPTARADPAGFPRIIKSGCA
jgi:hypothetical protein